MGIIIFLLVAKLQDIYQDRSTTWSWALGYALAASLLGWAGIIPFVLNVIILGLYAWGYFGLLRRFTDNLLLWLLVLAGGVIVPIVLPLLLAKQLS